MNDSEVRRRELLRQTRKLYHDSAEIPAVHPRYGRIYSELYSGKETEDETGGSFYLRLAVGILCFICFVYMEQSGVRVWNVSSSTIAEEIEKDVDTEMIREVWNSF